LKKQQQPKYKKKKEKEHEGKILIYIHQLQCTKLKSLQIEDILLLI